MNLLEHFVKEIHSEEDVTEEFDKRLDNGEKSKYPLIKVDMTYDCYGVVERKVLFFHKPELDKIKETKVFWR